MMEEKEKDTEQVDIPTYLRLNRKSKDEAEDAKEGTEEKEQNAEQLGCSQETQEYLNVKMKAAQKELAEEQQKTKIDPITLAKMLDDFQSDLKRCIENEEPNSGVHQPILLGNFIVDTYNGYLSQAKEILTDPIIQNMNDIDRLPGDIPLNTGQLRDGIYIPEERLSKMNEVYIACRQLASALTGAVKDGRAGTHSELVGAMAFLVGLNEQIEKINNIPTDNVARGFIRQFAEQYNSALEMVLEATDDTVLEKLFQPLEIVSDDAEESVYQEMFYRLKIAIGSLTGYLRTRHGRSGKPYSEPSTSRPRSSGQYF